MAKQERKSRITKLIDAELLTGEEVMDLVTDFHFSGKTNRYILVRSAEKLIIVKLKALGYEQVYEDCPHCYGTGQGYTRECPTCNGTGKVRRLFPLEGIEELLLDIIMEYHNNPPELFKQILSLIRGTNAKT